MPDFAEKLNYYDTQCRQHLGRVRLSHVLALRALKWDRVRSDENLNDLIRASFENVIQDVFETKLRMVLHELHLVSLKANFELFLNRLLTTIWTSYFTKLAPTISDVTLRELAESFLPDTEPSAAVRDFIVNQIVRVHGLPSFVEELKKSTHINLPDVLNRKSPRYWPQIRTAFEVRHLVEHRDGKVDKKFRRSVKPFWSHSSWGKHPDLEVLKKVDINEEDVIKTYAAMLEATGLLTEEVLRWSSDQGMTP